MAGIGTTIGYWKNWLPNYQSSKEEDYRRDFENFTHVCYAFLTIAAKTCPEVPPVAQWDGRCVYESYSGMSITDVMDTSNAVTSFQRVKIQAMLKAAQASGKKFIWSIGGWSDLVGTLDDQQVPAFVTECVKLLETGGDGVDFDWEHLSHEGLSEQSRSQQRHVLGKVMAALRKALNSHSKLSGKIIVYTTQHNAFWNPPPQGIGAFLSDGEGIDTFRAIKSEGLRPNDVISFVNIMCYDTPPWTGGPWKVDHYKVVLSAFEHHVPREKIAVGFEPGPQAGGVVGDVGLYKEVIDYLRVNKYGAIMFWAMNEDDHSQGNGEDSNMLAKYALR